MRPGGRLLWAGAVLTLGLPGAPAPAMAQSLPAAVRVELESEGHERFADRLSDRMGPRSSLDAGDVRDLLERWERADGGPSDEWDWLTVTRLWLRAGEAERAAEALQRVAGEAVPPGVIELDRARIGFLDGRTEEAAAAYWRACEMSDELGGLEAWADIEPLATPEEVEAWDRLRRLPPGQRDACGFLRRFWNERAARSGVPIDERIDLHYDRLRFAMEHYVRRGRAQDVGPSGRLNARLGREGAARFDDRGLLYLRLGPPDETARTIGGDCYEPNVSWFYRFPDGDRMYHLSPLGGNDNWWLLGNLGEIFRCPVTPGGRIVQDRNPMVGASPPLDRIPAGVMYDIYITRAQLDPRYARMAYRFDDVRGVEVLQDERDLTWTDGRYAISQVPERPDVRMDIEMLTEWLAFRRPLADRTRMWLLLMVSGEDLEDIEPRPAEGLEVLVTLLSDEGRQETVTGLLGYPEEGKDAVVRLPIELSPGDYEARVVLRAGPARAPGDEDRSPPSGTYGASSLSVPAFSDALPRLSDIAVSPDSGGTWGQTQAVSLSPAPAHLTNERGQLWIYFEAYNLTPGGRYVAQVHLEPEQGGAPFDLEFTGVAQAQGRIVTPSGLRLDLAEARPGRYRLTLTVRDEATGRVTLPSSTDVWIREPD